MDPLLYYVKQYDMHVRYWTVVLGMDGLMVVGAIRGIDLAPGFRTGLKACSRTLGATVRY
jgi:hypothetical protein